MFALMVQEESQGEPLRSPWLSLLSKWYVSRPVVYELLIQVGQGLLVVGSGVQCVQLQSSIGPTTHQLRR